MRYLIYNPSAAPILNPYANGNAWFVQGEMKVVENADAEMEAMQTLDPRKDVVIDKRFAEQLTGFKPKVDSTASIRLTSYRPNKLIYKVQTSTEQVAVFSEVYYNPGWQAYLDGKAVDHFRADWILRGMRIPAGEHELVFEFRPKAYIAAANVASYISFFILLLVVGAIGYSFYRMKK